MRSMATTATLNPRPQQTSRSLHRLRHPFRPEVSGGPLDPIGHMGYDLDSLKGAIQGLRFRVRGYTGEYERACCD